MFTKRKVHVHVLIFTHYSDICTTQSFSLYRDNKTAHSSPYCPPADPVVGVHQAHPKPPHKVMMSNDVIRFI